MQESFILFYKGEKLSSKETLDTVVGPSPSTGAVSKSKKPQQDRKSSKDQKSSTDTKDAQGTKNRPSKPTPKLTRDDKQ